ncbi:MAG TPA: ABC transporter permease [Vicinamibacterales bacterium]|nr:ABC transporter permease [Vicinamibacterales bacterium]
MQLDVLVHDAMLAWRNAVRRPAFTLLVVLTLALGIGVNSAVFALLDGVLLRPLPYRDPSRLVFVWQSLPQQNVLEVEPTAWDYADWQSLRAFSAIGLVANGASSLTGDDNPERVRGNAVTASIMPMLGLAPRIGRGFTAIEDTADSAPVVILGDGLWRRRYGSDPNILGRVIQVNNEPHTVVGVMPPRAALPGPIGEDGDLWISTHMDARQRANDISHNYTILARLTDGTTLEQATAELEAAAARAAAERPSSHKNIGVRLVPVTEQTVRAIRPTLFVAAGGVALLLLVASANAATLLIARAANRQHELAVRAALGATRAHFLSLAMMESLVLALLGSLVGLMLGGWALRLLIPLLGTALPRSLAVDVDARVALVSIGLACSLGLVFGAIVAFHRPTSGLLGSLKASARTMNAGGAGRTRNALVIAQVALAVVLLSAAGLMLTSVVKLSRVNPGFAPDHLLTFRLALTGARYAERPARQAFGAETLQRLEALPGVRGASLVSAIPFGGTRGATGVEIEGRPRQPGDVLIVDQRHISPGYFQTMGIPIVRGRGFTTADDDRAEPVVVINRTMAERYWPNENPIDRRVRVTAGYDAGSWFRIVGIADNVRHIALSREPVTEMYRPFAQTGIGIFSVAVKTTGEPAGIAQSVRAAVQAVDRNMPVYDVRTMEDRIAGSFAQTRGTMLLLLVTAVLAAALSGVAIYGSIWYSVSQRLPEIGIRLALGASRGSVFVDVLRRAVVLTGTGSLVGLAAALAAGRLLTSLLFETTAADPVTYALVIAGTMTLALVAGLAPARRATRVDPMTALRNE